MGYDPAGVSAWNTWKEVRKDGSLNTLLNYSSANANGMASNWFSSTLSRMKEEYLYKDSELFGEINLQYTDMHLHLTIRKGGSLNILLNCSSQLISVFMIFCPRSYSLTGTFSEN